jgi:hypothetical protein
VKDEPHRARVAEELAGVSRVRERLRDGHHGPDRVAWRMLRMPHQVGRVSGKRAGMVTPLPLSRDRWVSSRTLAIGLSASCRRRQQHHDRYKSGYRKAPERGFFKAAGLGLEPSDLSR